MKTTYARTFFSKKLDAIACHTIMMSIYLFFLLLCRGKIRNKENLKQALKQGKFILAANHVSYLDWLILWAYFRYNHGIRLKFLAKEKLFNHRIWGMIMRHAECIKVKDDGTKILDQVTTEGLKGYYMAIFPEGKRSVDGSLQEFKKGVLVFAKKCDKVILPIGLNGFYESWSRDNKTPRIRKLSIDFGIPISPDKIDINESSLSHLKEVINLLSNGGNDKVLYRDYNQKHAFIDVDNTLTSTNIGNLLFFIKKNTLPNWKYQIWKYYFSIVITPLLLILDKISRPHVQQYVFSLYKRYDSKTLLLFGEKYFQEKGKYNFISDTYYIIQQLKKQRSEIVLVSTNLNCFVRPIAEYFDIKYHAVDLSVLKNNSYHLQIQYLNHFKSTYMQENTYHNSIGIGDSKYDRPIFENVTFPLIRSKKLKITGIHNVQYF